MAVAPRWHRGGCEFKSRWVHHIKLVTLKRAVDSAKLKAPQLALDVLLKNKTWKQAFAEDWRKTKSWQPDWEYQLF